MPFISQAQGIFRKSKDGSIKGALEFLPNGRLADGFQRAASQFPEHKDPMVDPYKWIEADGFRMRGLVKDAVLFMQWWTLLGDPAERYSFKWITSGQYEIEYVEKGQRVTKFITRSQLTKYPDLLKKFDRIEPYNVNVEITFNSGDIDNQKYYDFRKKYNVNTDLGSAGFKSGPFTIVSLGVHYLFAPSNQDPPFVIPTMAVGGWKDFLNLPKDMSEAKVKSTVELFRLGRELKIHSFRITDLQWPLGTLAEIAKQYERYEKKEDTPKEVAEKGDLENHADEGDDFWNKPELASMEMEVYYDKTVSKYGLKAKKGLFAIPAVYNQLVAGPKGVFFGKLENKVVAVNNLGKELTSLYGKEWWPNAKGARRSLKAPEPDCASYDINCWEEATFENGQFTISKPMYSISRAITLTVISADTKPSSEEQLEAARRECYREAEAAAESAGFTKSK